MDDSQDDVTAPPGARVPRARRGGTRITALPVRPRRRRPAAEYALNNLITEVRRACDLYDQIVLDMDKGDLLEMPEFRATREAAHNTVAALLQELHGSME